MKFKHVSLLLLAVIAFILCGCGQSEKDIPQLQEQYLGQTPPSDIPEIFGPGIVSDDSWAEHCQVAISPRGDEIFWSAWTSEYKSAEGKNTEQIFFTRFQNGEWTKPALAKFVKDHLGIINGGPVFSRDGEKLFFYSVNRPGGLGDMDTWYVRKTEGGWSNPVNVGKPYNTDESDWTPTFTNSGFAYSNFPHTLQFEYSNGHFSQPDTVVISEEYIPRFPIYLSPDESYVLFSAAGEGSFGGLDLYLCFKDENGAWGEPRNLGSKINTEQTERFPVVSPDGKYLFFMRHTESQDFFWVSTRIFDELRKEQSTELQGDYLGQALPGETPAVFAPGIISNEYKEHWAPRFSPDGNEVFWWSIWVDAENSWHGEHKTMRRIGDKWQEPEISPYDNAPIYSPDGQRLYFGGKEEGDDLSFVTRQSDGWSELKSVGLVAGFPAVRFAYFPSISSNGTLYFMGYLEGQWANLGIYRSEFINGEYAKPELLPPSINTLGGVRNWTPFIAPDESYLIFCTTRGLPASDQGDLYISFRQPDGDWAEPVSLGETINSNGLDRFPAVSPDGKYLFFTQRTADHDEDVFWVSAEIIERLKEDFISSKY